MRCLVQGENTLSCYIIVNKILIIRVIFHLPYCSPILVYICWLHFGLAFSNFCLFRHMLAAVTCFCFSYFLPNKYLLIPNCFRHGAHLTLTPLCFSERIQCSHLKCWKFIVQILPTTNPCPAPRKYLKVLLCRTRNTTNRPELTSKWALFLLKQSPCKVSQSASSPFPTNACI